MAPQRENSVKGSGNTRGGSVSKESDPEKSYTLSEVREVHGVDHLAGIRTHTADLHVRMSVGKKESGSGTANVSRGRNERERCR